MQRKPNKLTLTAPKEPEFETAQRVRPTTVKSSAELEEEIMAKIPKFKARPLNKKVLILQIVLRPLPSDFEYFLLILWNFFLLYICEQILEAPNLPALPKSTPQLPEFKVWLPGL